MRPICFLDFIHVCVPLGSQAKTIIKRKFDEQVEIYAKTTFSDQGLKAQADRYFKSGLGIECFLFMAII